MRSENEANLAASDVIVSLERQQRELLTRVARMESTVAVYELLLAEALKIAGGGQDHHEEAT